LGLLVAGFFVAGALVGCENSSSTSSPDGGSLGGGDFDASSGGPGNPDAATEPNPGDAAAEAAAGFTEPGIALANLWGTGIDFCFRPPGATDYVGPVFQTEGGIPNGAVSVTRSVPVASMVALIPSGQNCASTPLFTPGTVTSPNTARLMLVVRNGPSADARKVFVRPADHVAGKEMIYYGPFGRDGAFVPNGGGAPIEIRSDRPTAVDPNVSGELQLTAGANPTFTRPMKTAVGVLWLIETPTEALLCDELAPNGHLLSCGSSVRAP